MTFVLIGINFYILQVLIAGSFFYDLFCTLITEVEYVIQDGDTLFSICSYVAETDEAINLVEGERVYLIGILIN